MGWTRVNIEDVGENEMLLEPWRWDYEVLGGK
jgi:hypothetical protein